MTTQATIANKISLFARGNRALFQLILIAIQFVLSALAIVYFSESTSFSEAVIIPAISIVFVCGIFGLLAVAYTGIDWAYNILSLAFLTMVIVNLYELLMISGAQVFVNFSKMLAIFG